MASVKMVLGMLFYAVTIGIARAKLPDHFFPLKASKATVLEKDTSGPIPLRANFTLFGKTTNFIVVNEDGLLSFPKGKTEMFPITAGHVWRGAYLSVLWTDQLRNPYLNRGKVQYREFTNRKMLNKAKDMINNIFQCEYSFEPESVFVVTWHNVRTRLDCVNENSVEFCDCLASGSLIHYCLCRKEHSKLFCDLMCMYIEQTVPESFCNCLDRYNDHDYCKCVRDNLTDCSCLEDHDSAYCDCLAVSNSTDNAWNCSCLNNYSPPYCSCLLSSNENHDYCTCLDIRGSNCDCYLYRSKTFCDCFRLSRKGNEGYCDCVEKGNDFKLCGCINELYETFFLDSNIAKTYCNCVFSSYGRDADFEIWSSYCACVATQDSNTCLEDTKRDTSPTCLEDAQEKHLVKAKGSSFQAVLISGGGRSFVIYNYGYFSTGIEDISKKSLNLRQYSAFLVAGNNRSDYFNTYYEITNGHGLYSESNPWCLLRDSNTGIPGQIVYRTDQAYLEAPDCTMLGSTKYFSYSDA